MEILLPEQTTMSIIIFCGSEASRCEGQSELGESPFMSEPSKRSDNKKQRATNKKNNESDAIWLNKKENPNTSKSLNYLLHGGH